MAGHLARGHIMIILNAYQIIIHGWHWGKNNWLIKVSLLWTHQKNIPIFANSGSLKLEAKYIITIEKYKSRSKFYQ